jgi:hypothetical protein
MEVDIVTKKINTRVARESCTDRYVPSTVAELYVIEEPTIIKLSIE